MASYFPRLLEVSKMHAGNMGVFLGFITLIPFISLGYVTFLYLFSLTGFEFFATKAEVALLLQPSNIIFLGGISAAIISVFIICIIVITRKFKLILVLINCFLLFRLGQEFGQAVDNIFHPMLAIVMSFYVLVSISIIVTILVLGELSFFLTVATIFLLTAQSFGVLLGYYIPIFELLFSNYTTQPLNIFSILALILFLRGCVKFSQENNDFFVPKRKKATRLAHKTTWKLWWPMLMVFGFFTIGNVLLQVYVIAPAVIKDLDQRRLNLQEFQTVPPEKNSGTISEALQGTIAKSGQDLTANIKKTATEISKYSNTSADKIVPRVRQKMPNRFPGTQISSCSWYDIICHIKNGIKSMINSGYLSARENLLTDLQKEIDKGKKSEAEKNAAAVTYLNNNVAVFVRKSQQRVMQTSKALSLISFLLFLYSLLVVVKSYFIVFARIFYSTNPIGVPGEEESGRAAPGSIEVVGNSYQIKNNEKEVFYLTFKALGPNAVDRRRIPQFLSLVFARITRGRYMFCKVDMTDKTQPGACEIKVDAPCEIVKWSIKDKQEVFVNIGDLIGFSESCTLGRRFSLHISSLVFGRIIYHSITGPGTIFLKTSAAALAGNKKESNAIMHSSSLLAWSSNAEFNIKSSLTMMDVFFSGYSIAKAPLQRYLVVYDTSQDRRVGAGRGIWRMIRTFLLPI